MRTTSRSIVLGLCLYPLVTASCSGPQVESYHVASGQAFGLASASASLAPASLEAKRATAARGVSTVDRPEPKPSTSGSHPSGSPGGEVETLSVTESLERDGRPRVDMNPELRPGLMNASFDVTGGSALGLSAAALGAAPASESAGAAPAGGDQPPGNQGQNLAELGAKLSNPLSDVWALFTQFGLTFNDGDLSEGDTQLGGNVLFQPVLPLPLTRDVNLIIRPTVPFLFGQPVPKGQNEFNHLSGIGDIGLPMLASPKMDNWILGAGPTFTLPASTQDKLGQRQWTAGPAAVVGYKTKEFVVGVFPQYFWGIGSRGDQGDTPDASNLQLLYFGFLNLPETWQVGFNPTVTYNDKATNGNKWNVPIGLVVAKMLHLGKVPVKIQVGLEYSVVRPDDFGQEFLIKVNLIPVIPALIKSPLFGGL